MATIVSLAATSEQTAAAAAVGGRLGELTTLFVPSCPITWLLTTTKAPSQYPPIPTTGPVSCDPPLWADNIAQKGFAYYSPAICPSGFVTGCPVGETQPADGFPRITAGENAMYCIPIGFTCTSDTTDFRGGVWGYMRTASVNGALFTVGPAIQIRWRERDFNSGVGSGVGSGDDDDAGASGGLPTETVRTSILSFVTVVITTSVEVGGPLTELTTTLTKTRMLKSSLLLSPSSESTTEASVPPYGTGSPNCGDTVGGGGAKGNRPDGVTSDTSTVATVLSGILIAMIMGYLAVMSFHRYRRCRTGDIEAFFPFSIGFRLDQIRKYVGGNRRLSLSAKARDAKSPDAELGTDGPIPELGPGHLLGTKENPAELGGGGVRNSWMSRVSRILTARLRKEVWSV